MPVSLPGKSHGQRSLETYSPWNCKESNTTEQLTHIVSKLLSTMALILIVPVFSTHFWIFILFVGYSEFPREKNEKQWLKNRIFFRENKVWLFEVNSAFNGEGTQEVFIINSNKTFCFSFMPWATFLDPWGRSCNQIYGTNLANTARPLLCGRLGTCNICLQTGLGVKPQMVWQTALAPSTDRPCAEREM